MLSRMHVPPEPTTDDVRRARGDLPLRYEDVTQDGILVLCALPHMLGGHFWRQTMDRPDDAVALREAGVLPVLTRMVLVTPAPGGPISVRNQVGTEGAVQLAHVADAEGAALRIVLRIWAHGHAPRARTLGPPPPGAGEPVACGSLYAEHVFTRLFAPPAERRVTRLDLPGLSLPAVPPARIPLHTVADVLALPPEATPLDDALHPDAAPVRFGLLHTDGNQHVNSLVYPRLFEEAALRHLGGHGFVRPLLARGLDVVYRKPCFAGELMRVWLRGFTAGAHPGVVGALLPEADPGARPHVAVKMVFG